MSTHTEEALEAIQGIVGDAHCIRDSVEVEKRSQTMIPHGNVPIAFVYPGSDEEVSDVLKVAYDHAIPVWPISRGYNWGYGTNTAPFPLGIVLVLERMNKIEVNDDLAYAVIEAGVTYEALNKHLKEHAPHLWTDCTDSTPQGSVIGNALERGIGHTPYHDHFGNLCGMDVILPNGEKITTGSISPASKTTYVHKWGTGPYINGLFSQANFGVVVRSGIWLMPAPESFSFFIAELDKEENYSNFITSLRKLLHQRTLQSKLHFINDIVMFALLGKYPYDMLSKDETYLSEEARKKLRKHYTVTRYTMSGALYGTHREIAAKKKTISKELSKWGKVTFYNDRTIDMVESFLAIRNRFLSAIVLRTMELLFRKSRVLFDLLPALRGLTKGIPTEQYLRHGYFKASKRPTKDLDPARDGSGLIWFAPIVPFTKNDIGEVKRVCEELFHRHGFDFYTALMTGEPRSAVPLMAIFYNKDDEEETQRAVRLYEELCEDITRTRGYPQYRMNVQYMQELYADVPQLHQFLSKMKHAVDDKNIIAPGKYGI